MLNKIFKKEEKRYCYWLDKPVTAERLVTSWVNAGGDITSPNMVEWMKLIGVPAEDAEAIRNKYAGKMELEATVKRYINFKKKEKRKD